MFSEQIIKYVFDKVQYSVGDSELRIFLKIITTSTIRIPEPEDNFYDSGISKSRNFRIPESQEFRIP